MTIAAAYTAAPATAPIPIPTDEPETGADVPADPPIGAPPAAVEVSEVSAPPAIPLLGFVTESSPVKMEIVGSMNDMNVLIF